MNYHKKKLPPHAFGTLDNLTPSVGFLRLVENIPFLRVFRAVGSMHFSMIRFHTSSQNALEVKLYHRRFYHQRWQVVHLTYSNTQT